MKYLFYLNILSLITLVSCNSFNNDTESLFPIVQNGKMGFIDSTGTIKITPSYDYVSNFEDGLALAVIDSNYGYIDTRGKWAIEPHLSILRYLNLGYDHQFITYQQSKKADSVLKDFRTFCKTKHDTVYKYYLPEYLNFHEGLAAFYNDKQGYGFIDKQGDTVIKPQFEQIGMFRNGLAKAAIKKNPNDLLSPTKYGYIQKQGKWSIPPDYDIVGDFSEGKATVYLNYQVTNPNFPNTLYNHKSMVINTKNQILFNGGDGQYIYPFKNGYAVTYDMAYESLFKRGYNYIDSLGRKPCVKASYGFSDCGRMSVISNWGGTDSTASSNFILMLVKAKVDNKEKWMFIRPDLTPPEGFSDENIYDEAKPFSEDMAAIKIGDHWGYINPIGSKVIPTQFTTANYFHHNLAYVEEVNGDLKIYGYINKQGIYVWHGQTKI